MTPRRGFFSALREFFRGPDRLPETLLRGLRKASWVVEGGEIVSEAYVPDATTAASRADGGREVSINWEDNDTVAALTLEQANAQHGAARLKLTHVVSVNDNATTAGAPLLSYERADIAGNPHHGNLVFGQAVSRIRERQIAAVLALHSSFVPPARRK